MRDGQREGDLARFLRRTGDQGRCEQEEDHGRFLAVSGGRSTVIGMEKLRESIESELGQALELGLQIEEELAEAAGLIAEAEARFVRLAHPGVSQPPPVV